MSGTEELRPHVVGKLGSDGQWHVLLCVPVQPPVWDGGVEVLLTADQAERLAKQLIEHAALLRDKLGLPGGRPFCPTAPLLEGEP